MQFMMGSKDPTGYKQNDGNGVRRPEEQPQ
jgi:hypothetical protein